MSFWGPLTLLQKEKPITYAMKISYFVVLICLVGEGGSPHLVYYTILYIKKYHYTRKRACGNSFLYYLYIFRTDNGETDYKTETCNDCQDVSCLYTTKTGGGVSGKGENSCLFTPQGVGGRFAPWLHSIKFHQKVCQFTLYHFVLHYKCF